MNRTQLLMELERIGPGGHALAVQLLGAHDEASDLLQDVVTGLLRSSSYDAREGSFRAWFLAIVRNRCIDLLRIRKRRPEVDVDGVDLMAPAELSPEPALERQQLEALVKRELMNLPLEQREILILREYMDFSYAEIAKVLAIPKGTVMSRLHRARLELADRIRASGISW